MVWGCFGAGEVGELFRVKMILDKEDNYFCKALPVDSARLEPLSFYKRKMTQSTRPD